MTKVAFSLLFLAFVSTGSLFGSQRLTIVTANVIPGEVAHDRDPAHP